MDDYSGFAGAAPHPVLACARAVSESVKQAAGSNPVFMPPSQKREALVALHKAQSQLAALTMAMIAASDDVAELDAARDIGAWLTVATRQDPGPTHANVKLAQALDSRWTKVAAGMAEGSVNLPQSKVIVAALDGLTEPLPADPDHPETGRQPRRVPPEVIAQAEEMLVDLAADHSPRELKRLGDQMLEIIAPDLYWDIERRRLEAEEARAAALTRLRIIKRGDGTSYIRARIPDQYAARLRTCLHAFTNPAHDASANAQGRHDHELGQPCHDFCPTSPYTDPATGKRLSGDRVMGEAFCSFLETADPSRMPIHGGDATRLVVTIDWESLKQQTGIAVLSDGTRISAGQARRLACTAGILPAVFGGKSEVLDLGRSDRFYRAAQRAALGIGQPHCRAEHCTVPATWCQAHHDDPWSEGGATDLANGLLLCPWHHQRAHDSRYLHNRLPNGDVRFRRRP